MSVWVLLLLLCGEALWWGLINHVSKKRKIEKCEGYVFLVCFK